MNCFLTTALTSKAKGQYLYVALTMHALFQSALLQDNLPKKIPEKAIRAAVCLVRLCNFHTAIIAGREITNGSIISKNTKSLIQHINKASNSFEPYFMTNTLYISLLIRNIHFHSPLMCQVTCYYYP